MENNNMTNWEIEANAFYWWFKNLGGDVSDNEVMTKAFKRIT